MKVMEVMEVMSFPHHPITSSPHHFAFTPA
jgi:hypothetical protein